MTLVTPAILACATCFGASDSPMTQGANMAILTLLVITGVVLAGFCVLMISLACRARKQATLQAELKQLLKESALYD